MVSPHRSILLAGLILALAAGLACDAAGTAGANADSSRIAAGPDRNAPTASQGTARSPVQLQPCSTRRGDDRALCGTYEVFEDREARTGRTIALNIIVLPAAEPRSDMTPIFYLAGGPGGAATDSARGLAGWWIREHHDIVLVDQRGTGRSNPLGCASTAPGSLQGYLGRAFGAPQYFERCRQQLEQVADLRLYTTPIAMDDLNEVREALGYDEINLYGGSYGSRAALVYMRRHPETVRTATLNGIAPISFTNPLYHAREAQNALDKIFEECTGDADCSGAFPDLADKFDELMERLATSPAVAAVQHPASGAREQVRVSREAFADGLRVFTYYMPRTRSAPLMIHRAWMGDMDFAAQAFLESNVGLASQLQMGMLLSVTCAEDVPRIEPAQIETATAGTYLGDARVRQQIAACDVWPRGEVPVDYGEPVSVDVPVLLWSGTIDPVTGPRWGEEAASHLPRSLHIVVPGAHGVAGGCINSVSRQFLEAGTTTGLDTSCTERIRLPPFDLGGR